jgi:hypothetical protein
MSAPIHEYPCQYCPVKYRSTNMQAAAANLLRHESEHRHQVIMHISTGGRPEHGSVSLRALTYPVVGIGLFLWGWTHSSSWPNGATLFALLILAALVGLVLIVAATIRGYWVLERQDEGNTEDALDRTHADHTGLHIWDAL